MDMHTPADMARIEVKSSRLGQQVELVEPAILDVIRMNEVRAEQEDPDRIPLVLAVIALCLRVDGRQYSAEELCALGARKMKSVMALTGQALDLAGFAIVDEVEEDGGPKG
jgi:hypothetical protein